MKAGNDVSTERFFHGQLNVDIACLKFGDASSLFVLKSECEMLRLKRSVKYLNNVLVRLKSWYSIGRYYV